ncbi:MAG: NAD-dependent epimerase/dehydratase family protein [Planctomycetota bacterium]|jgi:2'-hydroxyisoflavone reductase
MPSRREFLQASLGAGAVGAASGFVPAGAQQPAAARKRHLLILGGTGFIGPHIVEAALAKGFGVTLFNRGRTNPGLFPGLESLKGNRDPDRDEGLEALKGRSWDGVIDTSGYFPRLVGASAGLLADHVGQYVFISSISVYSDNSTADMDESGPIAAMDDPTLEEFGDQFQHYGALKALCEQAAERAMPGRVTNIRPGLIVGPRDNVPRFTYWPVRVERGGEVLAPGAGDDPVQYIDGRDLADFVIKTLEDGTAGVFNATGPNTPTNMAEMLYGCKAVTGGDARFTWVNADFLGEQGIQPWSDMPVWIPPREGYEGFHRVNIDKAIKAGLLSRPLAETVRDTLTWYHAWPLDTPFPWRGGITAEREAEVLAAWHARSKEE